MSSGTEECGDERFPKSDSEDGVRAMVIPGRDLGPFGQVDLASKAPSAVTAPTIAPQGGSLSPSQLFLFPMAVLGVEEPWAAGQCSLGVMIASTSAKSPESGWGWRTPCSVDLLGDQRHDHLS